MADATLAAADRAAIEDLLSTYVLSLDLQETATTFGLFTEDGEFRTYGRVFVGDRLRRMFDTAPPGMHLAGRALIAPSAEGATVRQQLVFLPADRSPHRLAIYDDVVVHVDGRWLFRSRDCRFMNAQGVLAPQP